MNESPAVRRAFFLDAERVAGYFPVQAGKVAVGELHHSAVFEAMFFRAKATIG